MQQHDTKPVICRGDHDVLLGDRQPGTYITFFKVCAQKFNAADALRRRRFTSDFHSPNCALLFGGVLIAAHLPASEAEQPLVLFVDLRKVPDIALVKPAAVFGDIRLFRRPRLVERSKAVVAVDAPALQKPDAHGVLRAEEGTAHAHIAPVAELHPAPFEADVLFGAVFHAQPALDTPLLIHAVQKGVDRPARLLDAHRRRGCVVQKIALDPLHDAVLQPIHHDPQELVVVVQNFPHEVLLEGEMDVVGHHEVILPLEHRPLSLHAPQQNAGRSVVHRQRLAAVLVDEERLPRPHVEFFRIAVEGQRRIEPVDGIAEPQKIVSGDVLDGRIAIDLHAVDLMPAAHEFRLDLIREVARVVCSRVVDE